MAFESNPKSKYVAPNNATILLLAKCARDALGGDVDSQIQGRTPEQAAILWLVGALANATHRLAYLESINANYRGVAADLRGNHATD